ncbi:hypothetical protein Tco_0460458, partial [Tanacetum coccineum]
MKFRRVKRERVKETVVVVVTTDVTTTTDRIKGRANAGAMTNVVSNDNEGHLNKDCPTWRRNGQDGNNHGAVYKLGA